MQTERYVPQHYLERTVIFIDYHNLEGSLRNESLNVDLLSLRDYLSEGRLPLEAFVYIGFNPNNPNGDQNFHRVLRRNGFIVRTKPAKVKPDGTLKCDLDIELALDAVDYVSLAKPDIFLLVSGDGDFIPLAKWLRFRGIRVEIASTPTSISQELKEAANGYIDLSEAIEEIQRAEGETFAQREEVKHNGNGSDQGQADADPQDGI